MVVCSILHCKSRSDSDQKIPDLSFHAFPTELREKDMWIKATGRSGWQPKTSSKVCSVHFEQNVFFSTSQRKYLKKHAIPKHAIPNVPQSKDMDNDSGNRTKEIQVSRNPYQSSRPDRARRKARVPRSATAKRQRKCNPVVIGYDSEATMSVSTPESDFDSALEDKDGGYTAPVSSGEIRTSYSCYTCKDQIIGFLYTCMQCEYEQCGACEALPAHDEHLVLRLPRPALRNEIQSVLKKIREMLSLELSEPSIKLEVKEVLETDPLIDTIDPNMENSCVPSIPASRIYQKSSIPERLLFQDCSSICQTTLDTPSFLTDQISDSMNKTSQKRKYSAEFNPQIVAIKHKIQENDQTTGQFAVFSHNKVKVTQKISKNVDDGFTINKSTVCSDNSSDIVLSEPENQKMTSTDKTKIEQSSLRKLRHQRIINPIDPKNHTGLLQTRVTSPSAVIASRGVTVLPQGASVAARIATVTTQSTTVISQSATVASRGGAVTSRGATVASCGATVASHDDTVASRVATGVSQGVPDASEGAIVAPEGATVALPGAKTASRCSMIASRCPTAVSQGVTVASRAVAVASRGATAESRGVTVASRCTTVASQCPTVASQGVTVASRGVTVASQASNKTDSMKMFLEISTGQNQIFVNVKRQADMRHLS